MSGIAVAYGNPESNDVDKMLAAISHRGPHLSNIWREKQATMAQNYLEADLMHHTEEMTFPITDPSDGSFRICYDGQIGNTEVLATAHNVTHGPAQQERLLLRLYEQHGKQMCQHLDDATFAFVISNGNELFAARDLLGIKTLFYGHRDGTLYLASELKGLAAVTDEVYEFPPGHFMDSSGRLARFAALPDSQPEVLDKDVNGFCEDIRNIIDASLQNRVDINETTGALLSGGLDSSVITMLASTLYKEKFGQDARLRTFALGVGESGDIENARVMAEHCDTDHHELLVSLDDLLATLPEAIYHLESFDPSLVRSAVANFLISKYAKDRGIQVLLSGEGGDEVFCGYTYLKQFPAEELLVRQVECLDFLHNNASLRLDRMNQCHGVRVVTPLISGELLDYALRIPPQLKQRPDGDKKIEKWIFRKAYEPFLPDCITWRLKQEFSQGSGSADHLSCYFEDRISDEELVQARAQHSLVRSKEELYYFRLFAEHFGTGKAVDTVGQWITL